MNLRSHAAGTGRFFKEVLRERLRPASRTREKKRYRSHAVQKREAEDLIRTLQSQVMETLKQFPAQDSTLQHQVREQEGRLMAQATQIKQQSAQLEAQSAQIKQQRTQLEAQSAQIETLQSDLAKKEKDLTSLRKQLVQSGNVLQQVQQSLERGSAVSSASPFDHAFPDPGSAKS